jgi:hypothetical protein
MSLGFEDSRAQDVARAATAGLPMMQSPVYAPLTDFPTTSHACTLQVVDLLTLLHLDSLLFTIVHICRFHRCNQQ